MEELLFGCHLGPGGIGILIFERWCLYNSISWGQGNINFLSYH